MPIIEDGKELTEYKDKYVPIIEDGKELTEYKDEVSHDGPIIDGFKGDKNTNYKSFIRNVT